MEEQEGYRIGDLARMFGVTVRTIRYYEELKLLQPSLRRGSSHRRYPPSSAIHMRRIQQLKDYGLSLAEISKLFELARGDRSGGKVKRSLLDFYRQKLAEAERKRESLDAYIQELDWHVQQLERVEDFFQCPGAACRDCAFSARCDMKALAPGSREAH